MEIVTDLDKIKIKNTKESKIDIRNKNKDEDEISNSKEDELEKETIFIYTDINKNNLLYIFIKLQIIKNIINLDIKIENAKEVLI